MSRKSAAIAVLSMSAAVAGFALSALNAAAQDPPATTTTAPTAGQRVGNAVDRVKQGVRGTTETVRGKLASARASVTAMTVQSRVHSRLHWDRTLNPLNIEVEVNNDGVAILRGVVPLMKAKELAADLARETVGVTSVVDELAVRASSSTETTRTPGGTTTTTTTTKKTVVTPPRP